LNLYLLARIEEGDYDTYDACVVVAENEDAARLIFPSESAKRKAEDDFQRAAHNRQWPGPEGITVRLIGQAAEDLPVGCVLASFNAG
jgi:hypothetical protein